MYIWVMNTNDIKKANAIKPVGRPPENKSEDDKARGHIVSLSNNEKLNILKQYGSLTVAIRTLIKTEEK